MNGENTYMNHTGVKSGVVAGMNDSANVGNSSGDPEVGATLVASAGAWLGKELQNKISYNNKKRQSKNRTGVAGNNGGNFSLSASSSVTSGVTGKGGVGVRWRAAGLGAAMASTQTAVPNTSVLTVSCGHVSRWKR
jgi:hypothetical protein